MRLFGLGAELTAVESAESALTKARQRRDQLGAQLAEARDELATAKERAVEAATGLGNNLEDAASDAAVCAASVDALGVALERAEAALAEAQSTLAREQDRQQRDRSVAELEQLQSDMREPFAQLIDAIGTLLPLAQRAGMFSLDVQQVAGLLRQWAVDASHASEITNTALTLHAAQIESGRARAGLPHVDATKPVERPAPPVQVGIISKYNLKWTDHEGQTRTNAPFWDVGLPPTIAQRAIENGIAILSDDPDAKALRVRRAGVGGWANLDQLVDLDQDPPRMPDPPPTRWIDPAGHSRYEPAITTSAPLVAVTGKQSWITPTNTPTTETF